MDDMGDLQLSFDELADLVIALVQENTRQRDEITRLECLVDSVELELSMCQQAQRIVAERLRGSVEMGVFRKN